jgi:hypothetical protein
MQFSAFSILLFSVLYRPNLWRQTYTLYNCTGRGAGAALVRTTGRLPTHQGRRPSANRGTHWADIMFFVVCVLCWADWFVCYINVYMFSRYNMCLPVTAKIDIGRSISPKNRYRLNTKIDIGLTSKSISKQKVEFDIGRYIRFYVEPISILM